MNGLFFYIGLGLGLAAACGLRPFVPLLLAGALGSAKVLGVRFASGQFHFLQLGWWLLVVTVVLVAAYAAQILLSRAPVIDPGDRKARNDPLAAALAGLGLGAGALLFGGTLAAHGDSPWPGIVGGFLVVALAQRASWPVIVRARSRLADRAAREALTIYLDAASLLLAALVALLHPLGYVAVAALAWFAWLGRSRRDEKYAGLRILRR
ncbi:MAG TPA: hypothetical protein VK778_16300 [Solirubrobacteraceae bacterium]|jgi:hypothetical protein|nr:hypothetical protein [Solirubrobacteraceae bacterium]